MDPFRELLEIVDESGRVIGLAPRSELHGNPSLIHRVVHVLVFNGAGDILLQKRALCKDVAPGTWDTSVGGHVHPGEEIVNAAHREMLEELGIASCDLRFLYSYLFRNHYESELVSTYSCIYEGGIRFNREEIDEIRFWDMESIRERLGESIFSAHFRTEIAQYLTHTGQS